MVASRMRKLSTRSADKVVKPKLVSIYYTERKKADSKVWERERVKKEQDSCIQKCL